MTRLFPSISLYRSMSLASLILVTSFALSACGTSQSQSYLLQYKKSLRSHYAVEGLTGVDEKLRNLDANKKTDLSEERKVFLPVLYASNLPFFLSDVYDLRNAKHPIRAGDNLNVIINKVHLQDNGLFVLNANVAVVVTVDDGKNAEPRNVLVAYAEDIQDDTQLPISDLLAFSTDSYDNEPVRIEITILGMNDFLRSGIPSELLTTGAQIGKIGAPSAAPVISLASQIGDYLIKKYQQQVLARFSFQLYPWRVGYREPISGHIGVPKVFAQGHYIILNTKTGLPIDPWQIHVDWDLVPYQLQGTSEAIRAINTEEAVAGDKDGTALRKWPIPVSQEMQKKRLEATYVAITIDDSRLTRANLIIDHMDTVNRAASALAKAEVLSQNDVDAINSKLDDIKSLTERISIESRFTRLKELPESYQQLLRDIDKAPFLNKKDRLSLINFVLQQVNFEQCERGGVDRELRHIGIDSKIEDSAFGNWVNDNIVTFEYEQEHGHYECRRNRGN